MRSDAEGSSREYGRAVPRFYFNLCNGAEFAEDPEGVELANYAAARRKAVESLRGVMAGDLLRHEHGIVH